MTEARAPGGASVGLYAAAFALMLGAGIALGAATLGRLRSMGLLWISAGLSAAAVACSLLALVLLWRRAR